MESYPGELLVGVFPLVFCADATLHKDVPPSAAASDTATATTTTAAPNSESALDDQPTVAQSADEEDPEAGAANVNDFDNPSEAPSFQPPLPGSKKGSTRSQFEHFLDAMAGALTDQGEFGADDHPLQGNDTSSRRGKGELMALFRPDEDSDDEDEHILGNPASPAAMPSSRFDFSQQGNRMRVNSSGRKGFGSPTLPLGLPRRIGRGLSGLGGSNKELGKDGGGGGGNGANNATIVGMLNPSNSANANAPHHGGGSNQHGSGSSSRGNGRGNSRGNGKGTNSLINKYLPTDTSYARALQHGEGFFQRARVVPISTRHGFPPSKDPSGDENLIERFAQGRSMQARELYDELCTNPIAGILPSGWLEKHTHALPSVLLVVAQVQGVQSATELNSAQSDQDDHLLQTLNNIQHCMASKRDCKIHVVGLVQPGTSEIQADQWTQSMSNKIFDETGNAHPITLLKVTTDLQQDMPTSSMLRRLHKTIQTDSLEYYLNQARGCKRKLHRLGDDRATSLLLPLTIRYCFKIAVYYEFQFKHEKSLRFFAEAYRHVENYFRFLLQHRGDAGNDDGASNDATNKDGQGAGTATAKQGEINIWNPAAEHSNTSGADGGEGIELSIPNADGPKLTPPPPPEDMVYQCRAMADWLNFKLVHAGFASRTQGGILAAAYQWQRHCQTFCNPRRSFLGTDASMLWQDWLYVSRQRTMISQLLERNPPRALAELSVAGKPVNPAAKAKNKNNRELEEVLMRCSSWRTYEAAAEALLQLSAHLKQGDGNGGSSIAGGDEDDVAPTGADQADLTGAERKVQKRKPRFVGSVAKEGFTTLYREESTKNHREQALDCVQRAIALFDQDIQKAKKDVAMYQDDSWSRSGARMHYLAGGILLGLERHSEAIPHLQKAVKYSKGWDVLELAIRRMLIECYEKHIPSQSDDDGDETGQSIASIILDSYFNAQMSNSNLQRALERFSSLIESEKIQWYRDCINEADSSLPFSFAVTFPRRTHATAGDSVQASILIKSNLDYAVHINSVTLLSMAGEIGVPSNDLLSAKNANVGNDGGIIVQAKTEVWVSTHIDLPKDLERIAIDESGNGGQKQGVAGKGSFAKTARPRMGGITAAAGARMLSEDEFGNSFGRPRNAQWSNKCLGGKPLRCDGMRLVFYPLYVEAATHGKGCQIELTIEKKQPKTAANIKRTPFEEDNYIASAWTRPKHLPFEHGPRCLRVLTPAASMVIINITEAVTSGKLLEGTVNRVVLRLQSGPTEKCTNIKLQVKCVSLLVTKMGKTMKIKGSADGADNVVGMTDAAVRTPILVKADPAAQSSATNYGYDVPAGWALVDQSQADTDGLEIDLPPLQADGTTYACFHLYRPSPTIAGNAENTGEDVPADEIYNSAMCQTDVDVSICYQQERKTNKKKKMPARRRARARPNTNAAAAGRGNGDTPDAQGSKAAAEPAEDIVRLEFSTSMFWNVPLIANFVQGRKLAHPSGNRHPTNAINETAPTEGGQVAPSNEIVVVDGEKFSTRCILEAAVAGDSMPVQINKVRFDSRRDESSSCNFRAVSGSRDADGSSSVIFEATDSDATRKLGLGSKFAAVWTSQATMSDGISVGSDHTRASLGALHVNWSPIPLPLPQDALDNPGTEFGTHGPLVLSDESHCGFRGPPCYVEKAPFEAIVECLPSSPTIALPFDVVYRITNKTGTNQTLSVFVKGSDSDQGGSVDSGVLISGLMNGEIKLGPNESQLLSYTAIATRVGKIVLPGVMVSSNHHKSWVIREESAIGRSVYAIP